MHKQSRQLYRNFYAHLFLFVLTQLTSYLALHMLLLPLSHHVSSSPRLSRQVFMKNTYTSQNTTLPHTDTLKHSLGISQISPSEILHHIYLSFQHLRFLSIALASSLSLSCHFKFSLSIIQCSTTRTSPAHLNNN